MAPGTERVRTYINYKCVMAKYGCKGKEDVLGQNCFIAAIPDLEPIL